MNAALSIQQNRAADIEKLMSMKMGDDLKNQVWIELTTTQKTLATAIIHSKIQLKREQKSCGFDSLDATNEEDDRLSLHEILTTPEAEEIELWRIEVLDEASEKMLDFVRDGGAAIGRAFGVTARMGQIRFANFCDQMAQENEVKRGGLGQAGFDFGRAVA